MPDQRRPNRLIDEKSPYLLQHAHNPVDWFPWGEDAFETARREDKPILLSIGYAACHWCHVMERESFENPAIAALMNEYFVNIKLDREERPDVDKIYMTAVSALTGNGGWPLNVFLTPEMKPFLGGTYFPPDDRRGRVSWPKLVESVGRSWRNTTERAKIVASGNEILKTLDDRLNRARRPGKINGTLFDKALESFRAAYDPEWGGFSYAPKFPMPVNQNFLFRHYAHLRLDHSAYETALLTLQMPLQTLRAMIKGGIYDHVGGGFHRYSTDGKWRVPHFEKMLYDNAQIALNLLEAHQITREVDFARAARETLDYVLRDMTHKDGGFFSSEDADSFESPFSNKKTEGAFYLWEEKELRRILGEDADVFIYFNGVEPLGNIQEDPHGEFGTKNILSAAHTVEETALHFSLEPGKVLDLLHRSRRELFQNRLRRPRPSLDDKIITAWNGLMISALAKAAQIFDEKKYLDAAVRAADFIRSELSHDGKSLHRRWREGEKKIPGQADDHAFLLQGLLDIYESGADPRWLTWASDLADVLLREFYDGKHGGFFMTAEKDERLPRIREDADNVEPSANAVAAQSFLRLAETAGRPELREAAEKTLESFAELMEFQPRSYPQMLSAALLLTEGPLQITIVGNSALGEVKAMIKAVHERFLPRRVLLFMENEMSRNFPGSRPEYLKNPPKAEGGAAAYICVDGACGAPVHAAAELSEELKKF